MTHLTTTDDNAINHFQTIRDLLDNIEELHARGLDDRADAAMFTIKEHMNSLHNYLWLKHHKRT
jgi:hypothetical protein